MDTILTVKTAIEKLVFVYVPKSRINQNFKAIVREVCDKIMQRNTIDTTSLLTQKTFRIRTYYSYRGIGDYSILWFLLCFGRTSCYLLRVAAILPMIFFFALVYMFVWEKRPAQFLSKFFLPKLWYSFQYSTTGKILYPSKASLWFRFFSPSFILFRLHKPISSRFFSSLLSYIPFFWVHIFIDLIQFDNIPIWSF